MKELEEKKEELQKLKKYHKSMWESYGSELCAGGMIAEEKKLEKEIKLLEMIPENLVILKQYPHLLEFYKKSKIPIEFTKSFDFFYSLKRDKIVEHGDCYIIIDNKLVWDETCCNMVIESYSKESAYNLLNKSRKLIMFISKHVNHIEEFRLLPVEIFESKIDLNKRKERIKKLQKQGRRKRIINV